MTPRIRARSASTAALIVLAAMVPVAVATAAPQRVDTALPYVCAFPSGRQQATVHVSAVLPDRVGPREAIRPTQVETTVELPAAAVAALDLPKGGEVNAATRLAVAVAQNKAGAEATWRGTAQPVTVPESGPLTLASTGDVPSVTAQSTGDLTLSAGDLAMDLAVTASPTGSATPSTDPATGGSTPATVQCTLGEDAPGQGLLATVPVGSVTSGPGSSPPASPAGTGTGTPSAHSSASGRPQPHPGDPQSERAPKITGTTPGATTDRRDAPPCRYDEHHPATSTSLNAYVTGYSNVRKQKAASLLPLSCSLIEQGDLNFGAAPDGRPVLTQHSDGQFFYHDEARTPPFKATLLTFGFVPATATMVLEQTGPLTIDSFGYMDTFPLALDTYVRVPLVLHVTSLTVNGTRLDVGPSCRTRTPLRSADPEPAKFPGDHLVLHGRGEMGTGQDAEGYLVSSGGPLTGSADIPAFTGCGTGGEDLDPLLTASVSGPDNYIKQIQGQTCGQAAPNYDSECTKDLQPLKIPVPAR
nr:hypothetical protein StreXyl84_15240 [Streptomyces sp. Xyl84]